MIKIDNSQTESIKGNSYIHIKPESWIHYVSEPSNYPKEYLSPTNRILAASSPLGLGLESKPTSLTMTIAHWSVDIERESTGDDTNDMTAWLQLAQESLSFWDNDLDSQYDEL